MNSYHFVIVYDAARQQPEQGERERSAVHA